MTPREKAIAQAGEVLAAGLARQAARNPRDAALAAWEAGGPSVDELETRIRAERAQQLRAAS